jgi:hypothetical protein
VIYLSTAIGLTPRGSSRVQYSTVQYSTVQYSTVQYSTVQYSTVQCSTVQYSTVQYSTVQYSTPVESGLQFALNLCTVQTFTESEDTRCCVDTIFPPEDGHVNARNMSRIIM